MMHPALQAIQDGAKDTATVDGFIAAHAFPLVDGNFVTFVWRGHADLVNLRHWIYGLGSSQALRRMDGTDLWHLTLEIPPTSRVEYKLEVVRSGHGEWQNDPLNTNRARDPFGANSVAHATGYEIPEWTRHDPSARAGRLDEEIIIHSKVFGRRSYGVYLPARFRRSRRYPLLVVHDGHDYLRYAALGTVLDNLIARLEIPDMIVALTSSPYRIGEYANDERHARFIVEDLVPQLERVFPLRPEPQSRCLMGASFGAVASLSTAVRYPGRFGKLLLQSGSFAFTDIAGANWRGQAFEPVVQFMNHFRANPGAMSERIFMSCGMYESLIYENRSFAPLLKETGMDVRYVEARDGHNWENWRDRLREGLSWLFPGPLLMVYE